MTAKFSASKVGDWLASATKKLEAMGIGSARLDCLILLEDELGKDRAYLLAHPETAFQGGTLEKLNRKLLRRLKHEPMAYIRGFTEFYGRKFKINKHVLEPRPESETMIDLLKNLLSHNPALSKARPWKIVDVGTGSGALAITAKLEFPDAEVVATDIDPKCLVVARQSAKTYKTDIKFCKGDLLKPLSAFSFELSAILANLPYVPDRWQINEAAAMEPRIAIFGGPDGLDLYRRLFEQISGLDAKPKYILTESLPPQHEKLAQIAEDSGFKLSKTDDFIQAFTHDSN